MGHLKELGFKYLMTRRLNQDFLENFFGSVRQQGGNCINPTPIQFERVFKKLFSQNYLHCANCANYFGYLLAKFGNINSTETTDEDEDESPKTFRLKFLNQIIKVSHC